MISFEYNTLWIQGHSDYFFTFCCEFVILKRFHKHFKYMNLVPLIKRMFCSQWFFVHMLISLLEMSFIFEKNEILMPHWLDFMRSKKGKVSTLLCFCLFVIFVFVLFSQKLIFQFHLARKSMFLWKKRSLKNPPKDELFSHLNLHCFSFSSSEKVRKRMPAADSQPAADLQHARDGVAQSDGHLEIHDDTSFPNKSEQQPKENFPVPGTWSPLLTKVCLCTALALSAFACYRAYFHWCPTSPSLHWRCKVDKADQSARFDSARGWIVWSSADSLPLVLIL